MQIKYLIPLIILVVILTGGVYYYQKQNSKENSLITSGYIFNNESGESSGIALGDTDTNDTDSNSSEVITSGEVYVSQINLIRSEIIKDVNELNSRMKYKSVFDDNSIVGYIGEILEKNKNAINKLKDLKIDPRFNEVNKKQVESLEKITESLVALRKSYTIDDKIEAQRQKELYAYNLEQSDSIYKSIQVPK